MIYYFKIYKLRFYVIRFSKIRSFSPYKSSSPPEFERDASPSVEDSGLALRSQRCGAFSVQLPRAVESMAPSYYRYKTDLQVASPGSVPLWVQRTRSFLGGRTCAGLSRPRVGAIHSEQPKFLHDPILLRTIDCPCSGFTSAVAQPDSWRINWMMRGLKARRRREIFKIRKSAYMLHS